MALIAAAATVVLIFGDVVVRTVVTLWVAAGGSWGRRRGVRGLGPEGEEEVALASAPDAVAASRFASVVVVATAKLVGSVRESVPYRRRDSGAAAGGR